jgi:BTB/POZ domain
MGCGNVVLLTQKLYSIADQEIVAVSVERHGEEPHQFNIHRHLLCSHSPRFRDFLEDEDETKVMILREVGVEEFESFSRWLYTKELVVKEMKGEEVEEDNSEDTDNSDESGEPGDNEEDDGNERDGNDPTLTRGMQEDHNSPSEADGETHIEDKTWYAGVNRKGRIFARLLDLYILADTYKVVSLRGAVMLRFQRFIASTETLPCPTIVKHALDNLDFKSMMCKYLTHCYGHYTDFKKVNKDRFATLSPTFLTAVLEIAFQRIDGLAPVDWDDNWCDYHEHESDQGRAECENGRRGDVDVMKRQPRRRWGHCC